MRAVAAQKAPLHYRIPLTRASCAGFEARYAKNMVFACSPAGAAILAASPPDTPFPSPFARDRRELRRA